MKKKKENYQTVGQRIINALNRVPISVNTEFKRELKARSTHQFRFTLKESYDKDDTPAFLIEMCINYLNMDFTEFKPQKLIRKTDNFTIKLGLAKS